MGTPAGVSDIEWEMRCDIAASFRLSVRFGFNEALGNHFSLMLPDSDNRRNAQSCRATPGAGQSR